MNMRVFATLLNTFISIKDHLTQIHTLCQLNFMQKGLHELIFFFQIKPAVNHEVEGSQIAAKWNSHIQIQIMSSQGKSSQVTLHKVNVNEKQKTKSSGAVFRFTILKYISVSQCFKCLHFIDWRKHSSFL